MHLSSIDDIYSAAYAPDHKPYFTVHDGTFHADDVASVALASRLFGGSDNVNIIRTRDPKRFRGLLMDVGEGPLDHHGSAYSIGAHGIPESSLSKLYNIIKNKITPSEAAQLYFRQNVVDPVSKLDNGIALRRGENSLFTWVPGFNRNYSEKRDLTNQDERFKQAVRIAEQILDREIQNAASDSKTIGLKNAILQKAMNNAVVEVPAGLDMSKELAGTNAKFILTRYSDGTYRLKCVPKSKRNLYSKKVPFPDSWSGLSNKDLQSASGIPDALFCHSNGFLAGFKSRGSAMNAAHQILKNKELNN